MNHLPAPVALPSARAVGRALRGVAALAAALLAACGQPLPEDKAAYAGHWQGEQMSLHISPGGRVEYRRVQGATTTKISAPIQRFDGPHFEVGVGPFTSRFVVSAPPVDDGDGSVTMTVDGVRLVRQR